MRFFLLALLLGLANPADTRTLVTSIEPLAMLAREVLPDDVRVHSLALPGQTPHFAAFTPSQLRQMREADLILWLGETAEPHLADMVRRAGAPALALGAIPGVRVLDAEGGDGHGHGHAAGIDPHLWLSPDNMLALARRLQGEAARLGIPAPVLEQRIRAFAERLDLTVRRARERLAPVASAPWLSYHDPWRYLRPAFGVQAPLVVSEGVQGDIGSRRFAALATQVERQAVRCAIAEPEARRALMARLCSGACRVMEVDPLGRERPDRTYSAFVEDLGESFAACLGAPPGPRPLRVSAWAWSVGAGPGPAAFRGPGAPAPAARPSAGAASHGG